MRLARLIIVLTGFSTLIIKKVVIIRSRTSGFDYNWPDYNSWIFWAVISKSCYSKSDCPIGMKIDMYTHTEYIKAGWKGIFWLGRKGGILTPVPWRKSKFDPSWRPREQIITTFLIIDVQKPVNTIIEHVNLIFHYLFYRSQISLKMTEL